MTPKDRNADRHDPAKETGVFARLDNAEIERLDATRERLGIDSRRKAIITAIREWLDRNDPETTSTESEEQQ